MAARASQHAGGAAIAPTVETYDELVAAFQFFNAELFGNQLAPSLITLQRSKRTFGYFSPARFVNAKRERAGEIALNPTYFCVQSVEEVLSTLVHEQVHGWQQQFGKPGRRGYHNEEWAWKMREIGLEPSSTGRPGGRPVGESMSHYIVEGGRFIEACRRLLTTNFGIVWYDRFPPQVARPEIASPQKGDAAEATASPPAATTRSPLYLVEPPPPAQLSPPPTTAQPTLDIDRSERPVSRSNRSRYTCPRCRLNAWAKPAQHLICGTCRKDMAETE
ncbi:MAG TPA: SprT-like domain-containing protein [Burkholderiales bacterium]|nr:SprT-like domain-containing protein [Burkholderiales bacterium]